MGLGKIVIGLGLVAVLVGIAMKFCPCSEPHVPQSYFLPNYWGSKVIKAGEPLPKDSKAITKFVVNIKDSVLIDLKERLNKARITESIPGVNFEYGFHSDSLKKVTEYWKTKYDWRRHEKEINQYNHFKTQIEGLEVHFMHIKPTKPAKTVLPLIMVHGWPGSFYEHLKIIPLLIEPVDGVAFELIIPSLPGYGFSEAPHKPGFNIFHAARVMKLLMERLGHQKFFYQGGDWGAIVGKAIAVMYPDSISGFHTLIAIAKMGVCSTVKMIIGSYFPQLVFDHPEIDSAKMYPVMDKLIWFGLREFGYMHIQSTKPDTVGAGLSDSPVGLAAYILEKFSTWVNGDYINRADGGLTEKFTLDELLTNVMIYWVTNSITSSQRFYKENMGYEIYINVDPESLVISEKVPIAIANFPQEILSYPKTLVKPFYPNIVQYNHLPRGGHFAAFEEPKLMADDIRAFVRKVIGA